MTQPYEQGLFSDFADIEEDVQWRVSFMSF